ncbi:hypothetical protein ABZ934_29785 [Streptomyces sp. NPDC046557]|uniref:hypothetical protein n=1 Tax=Streptomyces sp. NPDC046557 TaxID=3155372 RepID=UPI0034006F01
MKKLVAAAGVVAGGAALVLSMQGSAQAAAPQAPVTQVASQSDAEMQPMGFGSFLAKAAVHAKAACPSVAKGAGQVANDLFGTHVAPSQGLSTVNAMDTVFDK